MANALAAADAGLEMAPRSARLFLVRTQALEALGRILESRASVRAFAAGTNDVAVLSHEALLEDLYGRGAPAAYRRAVEAAPDAALLERGLEVSLRDGDADAGRWFAERLKAAGRSAIASLAVPDHAAAANELLLPGGCAALLFIARATLGTARENCLRDYAKAVVDAVRPMEPNSSRQFADTIRDYFDRLRALIDLGVKPAAGAQTTSIRLVVGDKEQQRQAERVLAIFGWQLRAKHGAVTVECGETPSQAKKQDLALALGIDQVGMQEAFAAGKPFTIEIPSERVPMLLDEKTWLASSARKEPSAGGFAEALARDASLARVYVGLSVLDERTARVLLNALGAVALAQHSGERILRHASSLAIENGVIAVPGGAPAGAAWSHLVGADPRQPEAFLRALFEKDGGLLLGFYDMLAGLDLRHQRFFTTTPKRLAGLFDPYRESSDAQHGAAGELSATTFGEFLRSVPLDTDGAVLFPGSAGVWLGLDAKRRSAAAPGNAQRKAVPEVEDEILLRLRRTHERGARAGLSELDSFLAVVRIEQHRAAPLDEESASLLARHYFEDAEFYPYFASLTALSARDLAEFFALADKLRAMAPVEANTVLGHFDSLVEILRLAVQAGAIDPPRAASLFAGLCTRLAQPTMPARSRPRRWIRSPRCSRPPTRPTAPVATWARPYESCCSGNPSPRNGTSRSVRARSTLPRGGAQRTSRCSSGSKYRGSKRSLPSPAPRFISRTIPPAASMRSRRRRRC